MNLKQTWFMSILCVWTLSGCVPPPPELPEKSENTFLAVDVTSFGGPEALPLRVDGVTSEANLVILPEELVQSAPEEITMTLNVPQIDPGLDAQRANPLGKGGAFHATLTFHLAPPGEDACASELTVGPYELSMSGGKVQIKKAAIPLPAEAAELVRSGQFEICAQTSADFDGALSVSQLMVEFGRLNPGDTRVEICHVPPGNPDVRHTITVAASAVEAHLAKGSYLGPCLDVVEPLQLTSVCSTDPDVQRRWRVYNPNTFAVEATWQIHDTQQTGALTALPGDTEFETATVTGANTTIIRWTDHNGILRSTAKASSGEACVVDSDGDGVADQMDQCPDTSVSEAADGAGCSCSQKDADNDGVNDCDDACADTPSGAEVDTLGCPVPVSPTDADGDGVPDESDACPDTPADYLVDEAGCSCSQLDEDGDGVNDCDDFCPGTPIGSSIDALGCPRFMVDAGEDITLTEVGPATLHATVSGGRAPYTYTWSAPGWAGSNEPNPTVMPAETTVYTLTVADWSFPPQIATDTVTVTVVPPQPLQYAITSVGSLSTKNSYANAVNDLGQVVGYYYTEAMLKRAFLYENGTLVDLGTLGGAEAYAGAINNYGQVVGQSQTAAGQWHAFVWDSTGGMRDLGTLGGDSSEAYAINASGQIAGFSATAAGGYQAFIYENGIMSQVPGSEAYDQSGAFDINDAGHMVGIVMTSDGTSIAFKYDGGLSSFGWPMLNATEAWLINNHGVIVGHSWGSGQYRSFVYANGVGVDLGLLDGFERTYAWALSDNGQVVGSVTNSASGLSHACIYTGGKLLDLNNLLVANHGWEYLSSATGINSNGQITGYGKINGQFRGFLLTPVP